MSIDLVGVEAALVAAVAMPLLDVPRKERLGGTADAEVISLLGQDVFGQGQDVGSRHLGAVAHQVGEEIEFEQAEPLAFPDYIEITGQPGIFCVRAPRRIAQLRQGLAAVVAGDGADEALGHVRRRRRRKAEQADKAGDQDFLQRQRKVGPARHLDGTEQRPPRKALDGLLDLLLSHAVVQQQLGVAGPVFEGRREQRRKQLLALVVFELGDALGEEAADLVLGHTVHADKVALDLRRQLTAPGQVADQAFFDDGMHGAALAPRLHFIGSSPFRHWQASCKLRCSRGVR